MKTTKNAVNGNKSNNINVEILVPVTVAEKERVKFERAMVQFIFGYDRLRPELEKEVAKSGVDLKHLANLSEPEKLSTSPSAGSLEFIPGEALVKLARKNGFNFTKGGRVFVQFNYDNKSPKSTKSLFINLELPEPLMVRGGSQSDINAEVVRALFGDCQFSQRAQKYLAAHGVDLVDIAAQNKKILGNGKIPPTTRVSPAVAEVLNEFGFRTDLLGQIELQSLRGISTGNNFDERVLWSKTTCC